MELDGLNSDAVARRYTWGLDLAGQAGSVNSLEGAGGIGGLLAVDQAVEGGGATGGGVDAGAYIFTYDGNGNVGQVVNWAAATVQAAIVAHYEYDPYGNVVNTPSAYAAVNPWRFSTKQFDDETGLGYWGYRYYSPPTGRWMSRDPSEEEGGRNLYAYVNSSPANFVDDLGLSLAIPGSLRITFSTTWVRQGVCGDYDVDFRFKMNGTAPCNGYLIQHISRAEDILDCSECCKRTPSYFMWPSPGLEYWEAWYVPKGSDTWELGTPDRFGEPNEGRSCGARYKIGEMKFFCRTETGDLKRDPNWSPTNAPEAGGLPATRIRPIWWNTPAIGPSAYHAVYTSWDCCCSSSSLTRFDYIQPRP